MKRMYLHSFILLLLVLPCIIKAQTGNPPVIYQNWKMIGESSTKYEVSVRVIRCHPDSLVQVHIELFNEGDGAQQAHFNLTITNPETNEKTVKEITYSMAQGEMTIPTCDSNNYQLLRIKLPASWDPEKVISTLTFIP